MHERNAMHAHHDRRSTQCATWLVLPFYQVYSEAGDFSIKNRFVVMSSSLPDHSWGVSCPLCSFVSCPLPTPSLPA